MRTDPSQQCKRAWLEYIAQTAIDMLDEMDAPHEDLEDEELGDEPEDRKVA
jgi:hypothetical protein